MSILDALKIKLFGQSSPNVNMPDKTIDKTIKTGPPSGEIGWDDSFILSMRDFPKWNPDVLISKKGHDVYTKMMLDDQVKAVMRFKQHAVISRRWYFDVPTGEGGLPDPAQAVMADFFNFATRAIRGSFSDHMLGILSALVQGFSITEKIYTPLIWQGKTYWGIRDLKLRPAESFNGGFETDVHGNILKIQQNPAGNTIELPINKIIHFVYQPDIDRHYGESDLRACYRPWWSKDIAIKFQNIFLERLASGFIWAKVTGKLSAPQEAALKSLTNNISARMGAIVPGSVDLNSFAPHQSTAHDRAVAQHDKAIAKAVLVPNLMGLSEQGQTGSYSQSETQLKAFFWVLDALADRLGETLNEQ